MVNRMFKHIQIEVQDTINLSEFASELSNLNDQLSDAEAENDITLQSELRNEIRVIESVIERCEHYSSDRDVTLILDSHFKSYILDLFGLDSFVFNDVPRNVKESVDWNRYIELYKSNYADVFFRKQTYWIRCD